MNRRKEVVESIETLIFQRTKKIEDRIREMNKELSGIEASIKSSMSKLVQCEVNDDNEGKATLDKKIIDLKQKKSNLIDKIGAYKDSLNDTSYIKAELQKLFEAVKADAKERKELIESCSVKKAELKKNLENIETEIETLERKIDNLRNIEESKAILPLLEHIEKRPIKRGYELRYIDALVDGLTGELVEYYFEPEVKPEPIQPIRENLCRSTTIYI